MNIKLRLNVKYMMIDCNI